MVMKNFQTFQIQGVVQLCNWQVKVKNRMRRVKDFFSFYKYGAR